MASFILKQLHHLLLLNQLRQCLHKGKRPLSYIKTLTALNLKVASLQF